MSICANLWSEKNYLWSDFFCPQIITDFHRLLNIKDILIITDFLGTEIHGFFKDTAWLRIVLSTALRGYGLLRKFAAFFSTEFFVHRLAQIITDYFNI